MAFNLMGLFVTILTCFNLLPAEAYDQKYNQENFYRYYDEDQEAAKENEIKRYKWMAEGNLPTANSLVHDNASSENSPVITSPLDSQVERSVDFLKNQDKLLNAVSLIRQVLRSAHPSKKVKDPNMTEVLKLTRNVLPATKKGKIVGKVHLGNEADANQDKDESEKIEHGANGKASRSEEVSIEKQEKLKKEFWETNKEKYPKNLIPEKDEIENLTLDELNNFDSAIEDGSDDIIKREDNIPKVDKESSTASLPDFDSTDSTPSTIQSFTEQAKSFIRRHLWFKHKAKVGLNNINKAKRFKIRKKRIGELVDNREQFPTENKGIKRDCGDPEVAKREVNGCGKNPIK